MQLFTHLSIACNCLRLCSYVALFFMSLPQRMDGEQIALVDVKTVAADDVLEGFVTEVR